MAKVYVVWGNNGMAYEDYDWWISAICETLEGAKEYIREIEDYYDWDKPRMEELEERERTHGLTEDEHAELQNLVNRWYYHECADTSYHIDVFDLYK